jgi:hypothetical protein
MKIKPVLLGAYCGFSRNNNPVIGKLVLNKNTWATKWKAMKEINHYYLKEWKSKGFALKGLWFIQFLPLENCKNF